MSMCNRKLQFVRQISMTVNKHTLVKISIRAIVIMQNDRLLHETHIMIMMTIIIIRIKQV